MICETVKGENVFFHLGKYSKLFYSTKNRSGILESKNRWAYPCVSSSVSARPAVLSSPWNVGLRFHEAADQLGGGTSSATLNPPPAGPGPLGATRASGVCTTHRPELLAGYAVTSSCGGWHWTGSDIFPLGPSVV